MFADDFVDCFQHSVSADLAEWLFHALDLTDDDKFCFRDWAICIDKVCRGTAVDLTGLVLRLLGLIVPGAPEARARAERVLQHQKVLLSDEDLDKELESIQKVIVDRGATAVPFHLLNTVVIETASTFLIAFFSPYSRDMEEKLKRMPMQSLNVACLEQPSHIPVPIAVICQKLEEIQKDNPTCVSFSPDKLYVHRSLVEAVTNAYTHGWTPTEGLPPEVLLMVLRTYMRLFKEPLLTLHLSRDLLMRAPVLTEEARIEKLAETIGKLPRNNRETILCVAKCARKLIHDQKSRDTLARILTYCIVRSESKASSTPPIALELTKLVMCQVPLDQE